MEDRFFPLTHGMTTCCRSRSEGRLSSFPPVLSPTFPQNRVLVPLQHVE